MVYTFDPVVFQGQYPEFFTTDPAILTSYWTAATGYLSPSDGFVLNGAVVPLALGLLTAHLARTMTLLASGQSAGVVTAASEGSVSVSMTPPPTKSAWGWWLSTTPYGQQLLALLSLQSAGGFYIGGLPERSAFRKVGGVFG